MSQYLIPRPRSGDGTMLPAVLVGLLASILVVQLAAAPSGQPDLDAGRAAQAGSAYAAPIVYVTVPQRIVRDRPIFSPARVDNRGTAVGDPLSGAVISGAWSVGRQTNLILRQGDGTTRTIRAGHSVNQWVFASITSEGARFWRDGKTVVVPFGANAPPAGSAQDTPTEEGNQ